MFRSVLQELEHLQVMGDKVTEMMVSDPGTSIAVAHERIHYGHSDDGECSWYIRCMFKLWSAR